MVALVVVVSHSHLLSSLTHARKYLATLPLALSHTPLTFVCVIFLLRLVVALVVCTDFTMDPWFCWM